MLGHCRAGGGGGGGGGGTKGVIIAICVCVCVFFRLVSLAHFWDTATVAVMCSEEFAKKTHFKF